MKQARIPIIVVLGVTTLTMAGCGTKAPLASSKGRYGGTAVVATPVDLGPSWFFPMLPLQADTDINMQVEALMYKPLLDITSTDGINYGRSLVSKVTANTQGTRYVLRLNPKWHWSNGHSVTAADVVFTWNVMKGASQSNSPWGFAGAGFGGVPSRVSSFVASGKHTIIITLNKASNQNWFEHNALAQISPVPKAIWDKHPQNMTAELQFIQSVANSPTSSVYQVVDGPFKPSGFSPNAYWKFSRNARYSGHKAYLNQLVFQYETQSSAEFTGLKTGQVDVGYVPTTLIDSKSLLSHDVVNQEYAFGFGFIHPNFSSRAPNGIGPILKQLYVRQALQEGIDQQGIVQSLYHGVGVVESGPIASQPPTVFYDKALPPNLYPFNPKAGKALLLQHGWTLQNGVMTKNGQKLDFPVTYISSNKTLADMAQLIKSNWAQEGVQVTLEPLPASTFFSEVTVKNPSAWAMALGGGWTYQPDFYPTGGGLFATGAPVNKGGYNNSQMDQLIAQSYAPGNTHSTLHALYRYEAFAAQHLPVLWTPWPGGLAAHIATLHGTHRTYNPVSDLLAANYWWFNSH